MAEKKCCCKKGKKDCKPKTKEPCKKDRMAW